MHSFAPRAHLATHDVTNQPPELTDVDLFGSDPALREGVAREAGDWLTAPLARLGHAAGREEALDWGVLSNRHPPELISFDRYGRRLDEVRFHPSYHALMGLATAHRVHDLAWAVREPGAHVAHAAMLAVFTQTEAGTMCPINMTYAAVPALRGDPDVGGPWLEKIVGGQYDAPLRPIAAKRGITMGMAMTEKQGGSDVRANTTRAERTPGDGARAYRLTGHKWFCSAPMSDGFLTLAYAEGGLTCFLIPRITPDGERNTLQVMRLKEKLGNRSNASSEIEYHGAYAERVGEEGRGVKTIIEMVHHTRLGTIAGTIGLMRAALAQALHHTAHRRAFQRTLIDQPLMEATLADLIVEYEAAVALTLRVARAFGAESEAERGFARLAVAIAKFWLTKRCPGFVYECMECLGGAGFVEESPLPRIYREAPLNAIWEGSGNVIALDILRTLARENLARESYLAELELGRGADRGLDAAIDGVIADIRGPVPEASGRWLAERMAIALQAALLCRVAPRAVADLFAATRLGAGSGRLFGSFAAAGSPRPIIERYQAA